MSVTLPPETFLDGIRLFAEVVTQPTFSDLDVEKGIVREEILEGLDEDGRCVDPDDLARAIMFPAHPLGMPITGSLASLDAIKEAVLREHHARLYTGTNAVLCIAGPIEVERCEQVALECFASMSAGTAHGTLPPVHDGGWRFHFADSQGSQTDLRLVFRAPGRNDPAEPAAEVLARLLDDGMSSRLYTRICDELGLCYAVSAAYEPFIDDGILDLAATVRHERAPLVVRELCGIVEQLAEGGPTEEELRVCKNRYRWAIESMLDDVEGLADYHGLSELDGSDVSLGARYERIERVTRDDVVEVARRAFRQNAGAVVGLGMLRKGQCKDIEAAVGSLCRGA